MILDLSFQGALAYSLCGIPSPPFHNQSSSLAASYSPEQIAFCYGTPYVTPTYLPPPIAQNFISESKQPNSNDQNNPSTDEIEGEVINESPADENNESEIKSQSSSSSSSHDGTNNSQPMSTEQSDDKHQDTNSVWLNKIKKSF